MGPTFINFVVPILCGVWLVVGVLAACALTKYLAGHP